MAPVICKMRSAKVDLPWSIWAIMLKLRMRLGSVIFSKKIRFSQVPTLAEQAPNFNGGSIGRDGTSARTDDAHPRGSSVTGAGGDFVKQLVRVNGLRQVRRKPAFQASLLAI